MRYLIALTLFVLGASEAPAATLTFDGTGPAPAPGLIEIVNPALGELPDRITFRAPGEPEWTCDAACFAGLVFKYRHEVGKRGGEQFYFNARQEDLETGHYWSRRFGFHYTPSGEFVDPGHARYYKRDETGTSDLRWDLHEPADEPTVTVVTQPELTASGGVVDVPGVGTITLDPSQVESGEEIRISQTARTLTLDGFSPAGPAIQVDTPLGVDGLAFDPADPSANMMAEAIPDIYGLTSASSFPWRLHEVPGEAESVAGLSWEGIVEGFRRHVIVPLFTGRMCVYHSRDDQHWYWPAGQVIVRWHTYNECADDQAIVDAIIEDELAVLWDLVEVEGYNTPDLPLTLYFLRGADAPHDCSAGYGDISCNLDWWNAQIAAERFCGLIHETHHGITFPGLAVRTPFIEAAAVMTEASQWSCLQAWDQTAGARYDWSHEVVKPGLAENAPFEGDEYYTWSYFLQYAFLGGQMAECFRTQAPAILVGDNLVALRGCLGYTNEGLSRLFASAARAYVVDRVPGWPQGSLGLPALDSTTLSGPHVVGTFREYTAPVERQTCLTVTVPIDANPDLHLTVGPSDDLNGGWHKRLLLGTENRFYLGYYGNDPLPAGTHHIGVTSILGTPKGEDQAVEMSLTFDVTETQCEG